MREHIAAMLDVLFEQACEQAEYVYPDGNSILIAVTPVDQDLEGALGEQVVSRQGLIVQARKAELPDPVRGSRLIYNGTTYSVRDPRDADALGLLWLLPLVKI